MIDDEDAPGAVRSVRTTSASPARRRDPVTEALAESPQVRGVSVAGYRRGLGLHGDQPPIPSLEDDVDLVILLAQVNQPRRGLPGGGERAQVVDDEGLEQTPEEAAIAEDGTGVDADRRPRQRGSCR